MDVALIIERVETWRGGAETSTVQFAEHLAELDCRVHVLTRTHMPSTPGLAILPIRLGGRWRGPRSTVFGRRAVAEARRRGFDIVHGIQPAPGLDVYQPRGGTIPETLRRNVALRGSALARTLKQAGQRLNLKYRAQLMQERRLLAESPGPMVIAISDYVRQQLRSHYHYPEDRIREVFNGIDLDETPTTDRRRHRLEVRRQLSLGDDELLLLCVAHNFKLKGVHRAIEALARLAQGSRDRLGRMGDRLRLVVVGRDNPARFVRQAQRLGVADRILFAGPTQRISAYFHAADVLVHPTYYDPCSRVVLEAMSAGVPVITTRHNGAAERVKDGREGFVVESADDVAALADRIGRLTDAKLRSACAAAAPAAVAGWTMRVHAERVRAVYEEILSSRKSSVRRLR